MSGSTTPTSAGSYTEAEMVSRLAVAADCSDYFKVKEINALLLTKGVKARGKKAQECKQVALACTADEVQAFRAEKEAAMLAEMRAKLSKRPSGQLTLVESVKRMRAACTHDYVEQDTLRPAGQRGVSRRLQALRRGAVRGAYTDRFWHRPST